MKLIIDFDNKHAIKISSEDDPEHFYLILFDNAKEKYSLWYDAVEFCGDWPFQDMAHCVSNVIGNLVDQMENLGSL